MLGETHKSMRDGHPLQMPGFSAFWAANSSTPVTPGQWMQYKPWEDVVVPDVMDLLS